jgi:hypothetical protein
MNDEKWLETIVTFGIVIRCKLDNIKDIKDCINSIPNIEVVYQQTSADPLYITRLNPSIKRGTNETKE